MGELALSDSIVYTPAFKDTMQSGCFIGVEISDFNFLDKLLQHPIPSVIQP
jgi:hypothetical protein